MMKKLFTTIFIYLLFILSSFSSPKSLKLLGTLKSPTLSLALLKIGNKIKILKPKETIKNTFVLLKVEENYILLYDKKNKKNFRLSINQKKTLNSPLPVKEHKKSNSQTLQFKISVNKKTIDKILESPEELSDSIRLKQKIVNGKKGYLVKFIKNNTLLQSFGIKNGDLIYRVNNVDVFDLEGLMNLLFQYQQKNLKSLKVYIIRNGSEETIEFTLKH